MHSQHSKFRIVCLDTDVLHTALVATAAVIHNARCNLFLESYREQVSCDNLASEY